MTTKVQPFSIHFELDDVLDLRKRIVDTRWPQPVDDATWKLGAKEAYMQHLLVRWHDDYNWGTKERELNQYPQFTISLDGLTLHFFHVRSARPGALPVLMLHGWPDSFLRYAKVLPLLPDNDLVVPSLPGFGFSSLPAKGFVNNAEMAETMHRVMTEVLGYEAYVVTGGDIGSGVARFMAAQHPEAVQGLHLTDVGLLWPVINAPDDRLSATELAYKHAATQWLKEEGAYINIHSTKPQTLAYSLSDSPVGTAAWITEKYRAWSDWEQLSMDDVLDCLTLYWLTNTAGTSMRAYYANTFTLPPLGQVTVPTAIALFPQDILLPPREWVEQHYPVRLFTEMPRGGHFTALEQPQAFAQHLSQFMASL
jgi:microsomal epoxide hydrolase